MAAPSKSFTSIADSAVDADSPLDETLMTELRDNDIHLEEWLGGSYTAAVDHDHDGVNSKLVTSGIGEAAIDWANAGGISQLSLVMNEITGTATAYTTEYTSKVYIPANANSLEYFVHLKDTGIASDAKCRLTCASANGTDVTGTTTTSYAWYGTGTLDISAESGWTDINIQLGGTGGLEKGLTDDIKIRII